MNYKKMTCDELEYCFEHCELSEDERHYLQLKYLGMPDLAVQITFDNISDVKEFRKNVAKKVKKALNDLEALKSVGDDSWKIKRWNPLKDCDNPKVDISTMIDILGTEYKVRLFVKPEDDKNFQADEYMDGYTDYSTKTIVIRNQEAEDGCMEDLRAYREQVLRHEIVHAFLFESGLHASSDWATNEEIVDWIAIQLPKIVKVLQSLNPKTEEYSYIDEEKEDDKNEQLRNKHFAGAVYCQQENRKSEEDDRILQHT